MQGLTSSEYFYAQYKVKYVLYGFIMCKSECIFDALLLNDGADLSYVLRLPHVGGDGSSVPGAVRPLRTRAGRVAVGVVVGVHAVVFVPPPCGLLLRGGGQKSRGDEMKLNGETQ